MIYLTKPSDFQSKFQVVGAFLHFQDKVLLLKRAKVKTESYKWGLPGGKVDSGETLEEALAREVWEETGIKLANFTKLKTIFVRHDSDFKYTMFASKLETLPTVTLSSKEHQNFAWLTLEEALKLDLVTDQAECFKMVYDLDIENFYHFSKTQTW